MYATTAGDVSQKIDFEWKIPKWKSLTAQTKQISTAPFEFWDASWTLGIFMDEDEKIFSFDLGRKSLKQDAVGFRLYIKNPDETLQKTLEEKLYFTASDSQHESAVWFKSEILNNAVALNGSLTISCVFHRICSKAETTRSLSRGLEEKSEELEGLKSADGKGNKEDYEKLSSDIENVFHSGKGSDVTFIVQDQEFRAHKIILRARSRVFDSMFTHDMRENNSGVVHISDCVPEVFKELLLYMYSGNVGTFSTNNVFGLYHVADKYDVIELKKRCVQFMMDTLSVETFCDVVVLAIQYKESELIERATSFFISYERKIIVGVQWLSFLKEHPVEANELHLRALDERMS